jgi:hypothetical protein
MGASSSRRFFAVGLGLLALQCGGVPSQDAEYPDLKLRSKTITLTIKEERAEVLETISNVSKLYQDEQVSFPQPLPSGFEAGARSRLDRLEGGSGLDLVVVTTTDKADLTFRNDVNGDTVRYDVTLAFRITTPEGKLIQRGKGTSIQELPAEGATPEEMRRVFLLAALNAFDQYFALEDTLERLNANIDSYLKSHPGETR